MFWYSRSSHGAFPRSILTHVAYFLRFNEVLVEKSVLSTAIGHTASLDPIFLPLFPLRSLPAGVNSSLVGTKTLSALSPLVAKSIFEHLVLESSRAEKLVGHRPQNPTLGNPYHTARLITQPADSIYFRRPANQIHSKPHWPVELRGHILCYARLLQREALCE